MENKLRRVFDYQKFNANSRLGAMIAETERRYQALRDEDLFLVSADGESDMMNGFSENKDAYSERNL